MAVIALMRIIGQRHKLDPMVASLQELQIHLLRRLMMKRFMKQWLPSLMIAVIVSLVVRTYIVEAMVVPSGSMIPTI